MKEAINFTFERQISNICHVFDPLLIHDLFLTSYFCLMEIYPKELLFTEQKIEKNKSLMLLDLEKSGVILRT